MTDALLLWLVVYAGLLAIAGFFIYIIRGVSGREWSNRAVLRASSGIGFLLAAVFWLLIMFSG